MVVVVMDFKTLPEFEGTKETHLEKVDASRIRGSYLFLLMRPSVQRLLKRAFE